MSPDKLASQLETEPKNSIGLNWRASKMELAGAIRHIFEEESSKSRDFYQKTRGGLHVEGLIYDLGHYGRGTSDFPTIIQLQVPEGKEKDANLEITMPLSDFLSQITQAAENYLNGAYRQQPGYETSYQEEVTALKALAIQTQGRRAKIVFEPVWENEYEITSLEVMP